MEIKSYKLVLISGIGFFAIMALTLIALKYYFIPEIIKEVRTGAQLQNSDLAADSPAAPLQPKTEAAENNLMDPKILSLALSMNAIVKSIGTGYLEVDAFAPKILLSAEKKEMKVIITGKTLKKSFNSDGAERHDEAFMLSEVKPGDTLAIDLVRGYYLNDVNQVEAKSISILSSPQ